MNDIVYPKDWRALKAPGTRFECMSRIEEIASWKYEAKQKILSEDLMEHFHFFLDDIPFLEQPENFVGLVIFADEVDMSFEFARQLDGLHARLDGASRLFGDTVTTADINDALTDSASRLLEKMLKKGSASFSN
jgi:hypothetical protein